MEVVAAVVPDAPDVAVAVDGVVTAADRGEAWSMEACKPNAAAVAAPDVSVVRVEPLIEGIGEVIARKKRGRRWNLPCLCEVSVVHSPVCESSETVAK